MCVFITDDDYSTIPRSTGNEVHISVCTETEYEKRDGSNHFGLKCQVVGYEWTTVPTEVRMHRSQDS